MYIYIVMIDGQPDRCGDLWQWMMTLGSAFHLFVAYFFFNCSLNLNNNKLLFEVRYGNKFKIFLMYYFAI